MSKDEARRDEYTGGVFPGHHYVDLAVGAGLTALVIVAGTADRVVDFSLKAVSLRDKNRPYRSINYWID